MPYYPPATSGFNGTYEGTLIVRQSGGTPGTDEGQISHDGSRLIIESKDGVIRIHSSDMAGGVNWEFSAGQLIYAGSGADVVVSSAGGGVASNGFRDSSGNLWGLNSSGLAWGPSAGSRDVGLTRAGVNCWKITNGGAGDGFLVESVDAALAAAGTTQGTATAITKQINQVTSGTGGVKLPAVTVAGRLIMIANESGAAINVYPDTGAAINDLAANAAFSLADNTHRLFYAISTTKWLTV